MTIKVPVSKFKGQVQHFFRTFEGSLASYAPPQNAVYHMLQYLRDEARSEGATFEDGDQCSYRKVFPHTHTQYNSWLREVAIRCGYPETLRLTIDSFRTGFLFDTIARAEISSSDWSKCIGKSAADGCSIGHYIMKCLEVTLCPSLVDGGSKVDLFDDINKSYEAAVAEYVLFDITKREEAAVAEYIDAGVALATVINDPERLHNVVLCDDCFTDDQKVS